MRSENTSQNFVETTIWSLVEHCFSITRYTNKHGCHLEGAIKSKSTTLLSMENGKSLYQCVRVKRAADVGSNHHLGTAIIKPKLMKVAPKRIIWRIDTGKLKDNKVRQDFRLELKNRYQVLQHYGNENGEVVDEKLGRICKFFSEVSKKTLGFKRHVHKRG